MLWELTKMRKRCQKMTRNKKWWKLFLLPQYLMCQRFYLNLSAYLSSLLRKTPIGWFSLPVSLIFRWKNFIGQRCHLTSAESPHRHLWCPVLQYNSEKEAECSFMRQQTLAALLHKECIYRKQLKFFFPHLVVINKYRQ